MSRLDGRWLLYGDVFVDSQNLSVHMHLTCLLTYHTEASSTMTIYMCVYMVVASMVLNTNTQFLLAKWKETKIQYTWSSEESCRLTGPKVFSVSTNQKRFTLLALRKVLKKRKCQTSIVIIKLFSNFAIGLLPCTHTQGVKWLVVSVCPSVCGRHKNTSSPDPSRFISAKYLQTV